MKTDDEIDVMRTEIVLFIENQMDDDDVVDLFHYIWPRPSSSIVVNPEKPKLIT